jgi:pimeloyl-ACP methyl ester carboxylesterase
MIKRTAIRLLGEAASVLDRAAVRAASGSRKPPARSHAERLRILAEWTQLYADPSIAYFRAPRRIVPTARSAGVLSGRDVVDLAWSSGYRPFLPDFEGKYLRVEQNHVAAARLFASTPPRPIAILIHGYRMGGFRMEQRIWPLEWLFELGLDVALFVLPFHGVRARVDKRGPPPFPGADPRMSNEGFRQALADLGDLAQFLRAKGHAEVGLMGMSLGGYTTALAATIDAELAFAVPIVPLACLADFAYEQGRLGETVGEQASLHAALVEFHRIVSPLARPPRVSPERVLVIGGKLDRITPIRHAQRLARHFNSSLHSWSGGHLLQVGRSESFQRIAERLKGLGIIA